METIQGFMFNQNKLILKFDLYLKNQEGINKGMLENLRILTGKVNKIEIENNNKLKYNFTIEEINY